MKELIFYRCNVCGNLLCAVNASGIAPVCCGQEMERVQTNTVDATVEKHVPKISQEEQCVLVCVGSSPHPMTEEHFISWIFLLTDHGTYARKLTCCDQPLAVFHLVEKEIPLRAYALCNLHGLWMKECSCSPEKEEASS